GAIAGASRQSQELAGRDGIAHFYRDRVGSQMIVDRPPAAAVIDDDEIGGLIELGGVAGEIAVGHPFHDAVSRRLFGDAGVHTAEIGEADVVGVVSVVGERAAAEVLVILAAACIL